MLTGAYYQCNPVHASMRVVDPSSWLFDGVHVAAGTALSGLAGQEFDRVDPGGAGGFDSGTSAWICGLTPTCTRGHTASARAIITQVTTNLLEAFAAGPAGQAHPAHDDLKRLGIG